MIEHELKKHLWLIHSHPHLANIGEDCFEAAKVIEQLRKEREFYRTLLVKYMTHVGDWEGTYFLGRKSLFFTLEEWTELLKLSNESDKLDSFKVHNELSESNK